MRTQLLTRERAGSRHQQGCWAAWEVLILRSLRLHALLRLLAPRRFLHLLLGRVLVFTVILIVAVLFVFVVIRFLLAKQNLRGVLRQYR